MMHRKGWTKESLTTGAKIKVNLFPARDGSHSGALRSATLKRGIVWPDGARQHYV